MLQRVRTQPWPRCLGRRGTRRKRSSRTGGRKNNSRQAAGSLHPHHPLSAQTPRSFSVPFLPFDVLPSLLSLPSLSVSTHHGRITSPSSRHRLCIAITTSAPNKRALCRTSASRHFRGCQPAAKQNSVPDKTLPRRQTTARARLHLSTLKRDCDFVPLLARRSMRSESSEFSTALLRDRPAPHPQRVLMG